MRTPDPTADPVVRDICAGMHGAWQEAACAGRCGGDTVH